ncbi:MULTISPECIES: hypothetical protein [Enterobacter cloacae complex]|uniref:hypothetical protein n=1 Tax=Enterobacter cloacae complex TaxID=354276 RepID=UPI000F83F945|nr:hypothetical protein [Enterobacter hormaechei]RTN38552.1 hypothetical protein EKN84_22125 [Enterobacter hormaechei]
MSTLTKEWLQQTIAELEEERDATPCAVNEDATNALAAMKLALASLEAEAVAFRSKLKSTSAIGSERWEYTGHRQPDAFELQNCIIERLYTAPPAQVVPEESTPENIAILASTFAPRGITYQWDRDECNAAADSWNACRAAMLQGAENAETPTTMQTAPALDSSPKIAESYTGINQGKSEPVTTAYKLPEIGWLRADYQDDNRGLRGNAPLFVLGKKDPSSVWGLDYIPLTAKSPVIPDGWVLVPEEPTHEMLEAGDEQFGTYDVYRRMVAASPQQK